MIVVDAAAIIDALLDARDFERLMRLPDSEEWHAAPGFVDVEVINGLRRLEFARILTAERANQCLADFRALTILRFEVAELVPAIWRLRRNMSAYDAAYVSLARLLGTRIVTRDSKLARTPGHDVEIHIL